MSELDLQEIHEFLVVVAKEGGKLILDALPSNHDHTAKKNSADLVTETDKAVETLISGRLRARYPAFNFIGEETFQPGVTVLDTNPTFVVDPIDGTSNFVHHFPAVCVSLAFVVAKQPTIGVVYNPFLDELFTGIKGRGSFTQLAGGNLRRLPLSNEPLRGLGPAMIGIDWGSDREGPNFDLNLKVFITLASSKPRGGRMINSIRTTGSAAITICRIAAGQQDMFWECGCWAWDVAAAWCILNEAGGMMVDGHPGNWEPPIDNRRYLAVRAAPSGQEEIVEEFWAVIGDARSTYGP